MVDNQNNNEEEYSNLNEFNNSLDDENVVFKKKQLKSLVITALIFLSLCGLIFILLNNSKTYQNSEVFDSIIGTKSEKNLYEKETIIDSPEDKINIDENWRLIQKKEINNVKGVINEVKLKVNNNTNEQQVFEDKIRNLEEKMEFMNEHYEQKIASLQKPQIDTINNILNPDEHSTNRIFEHSISLDNEKVSIDQKRFKTIENTIFATTIAKGVLLTGVVADTGPNSLSNPKPLIAKITDSGSLPNRFKSNLMDCSVLVAAVGNLSSERAESRIEKLVCINPKTGEGVETKVAGYVAGYDNKGGIKGTVVSKSAEYIRNSLVGALFSGASKTLTPQLPFVNPYTASGMVNHGSIEQKFTNGFTEGASNGFEKISDYYIKQLDGLQPVIEVNGGQQVDIIFTETVFVGSDNIHETVSNIREAARKKVLEQRVR